MEKLHEVPQECLKKINNTPGFLGYKYVYKINRNRMAAGSRLSWNFLHPASFFFLINIFEQAVGPSVLQPFSFVL